jgi:hypothetical protein
VPSARSPLARLGVRAPGGALPDPAVLRRAVAPHQNSPAGRARTNARHCTTAERENAVPEALHPPFRPSRWRRLVGHHGGEHLGDLVASTHRCYRGAIRRRGSEGEIPAHGRTSVLRWCRTALSPFACRNRVGARSSNEGRVRGGHGAPRARRAHRSRIGNSRERYGHADVLGGPLTLGYAVRRSTLEDGRNECHVQNRQGNCDDEESLL